MCCVLGMRWPFPFEVVVAVGMEKFAFLSYFVGQFKVMECKLFCVFLEKEFFASEQLNAVQVFGLVLLIFLRACKKQSSAFNFSVEMFLLY